MVQNDDPKLDTEELKRLFRATGSLGGARPKASILIDGELWLAKFPKPDGDDWNVIGWEALALETASKLGIKTAARRTLAIEDVDGRARTVLLLKRFDRDGTTRIPFISAMSALDASDGQGGDWLDLAEFVRLNQPSELPELWRRATYGALIGNQDDHLRNHGFL